jgi:steroid delta-isomerase-like uncharacterized protein
MPTQENKALVRRWIDEVWDKGNLAAVDEVFATGYIVNGQAVGTEGVKQAVTWLRSTFPGARVTIEDMIAEGDKVVACWALRGAQHGVFMDIPPTGKQVTLTGISIYRIADRKIVENRESVDVLGLLRQLGVQIAPSEQ